MASFRSGHFCLLALPFFNGWQWTMGFWQPPWDSLKGRSCRACTRATSAGDAVEAPKSLQQLFARALRFTDKGHNNKAIRTYKEILRSFPQCAEAWLNLGTVLCNIDRDRALQAFDQALALDPSYHDAHYNKGLVLDDLGLVLEALESFRLAEDYADREEDGASSAMYSCSAGLLLASEQQYNEALAAYDRAISADPEGPSCVDAYINRGELLTKLQRFTEAVQSHNKALELADPQARCGILYNLAFTYAIKGDKDACEKTLNRALSSDKTQVLAILLNFKGEASLLSQRRKEEMQFLKQLQDGSKDGGLLLTVIKQLRSLEENPRWILERLLDSAESAAATAYGTTWCESWWRLADQANLYAKGPAERMVVLGSSLGWQCFLGHLHLGYASCVGYEILQSQVTESKHVADDFGLDQIRFECQDAMMADLRAAKLIWLNAYAWPADVKERLCEKLLKELPMGALMVSYEAIPDDLLTSEHSSALELQCVEEMETSWDPQLLAHVYRKKLRALKTNCRLFLAVAIIFFCSTLMTQFEQHETFHFWELFGLDTELARGAAHATSTRPKVELPPPDQIWLNKPRRT